MSSNQGSIIHVLGTVGSGKGTQVKLLSDQFGMPSVSAGDLFRQTAAKPTDLGRRVDAILKSGALQTIDIWDEIVRTYLLEADFSRGYLLDGVVRTLEQNEHFSMLLEEQLLPEPWVLVITVDDSVALERLLKRGRADTDSVDATKARLAWSREQTIPVIDFYRARNRVVEVNGDQTVEAVHADILAGLTAIGALPKVTNG